jgi:hypothetical protein
MGCKSMAEALRVPRPWALGSQAHSKAEQSRAKQSDSSLGKAVVG